MPPALPIRIKALETQYLSKDTLEKAVTGQSAFLKYYENRGIPRRVMIDALKKHGLDHRISYEELELLSIRQCRVIGEWITARRDAIRSAIETYGEPEWNELLIRFFGDGSRKSLSLINNITNSQKGQVLSRKRIIRALWIVWLTGKSDDMCPEISRIVRDMTRRYCREDVLNECWDSSGITALSHRLGIPQEVIRFWIRLLNVEQDSRTRPRESPLGALVRKKEKELASYVTAQ